MFFSRLLASIAFLSVLSIVLPLTGCRQTTAQSEYQRGRDLLAIPMVPEAKLAFESALKINPKYASPYRELALIARRSGDVAEAIRLWQALLERDPNAEHAWCRMARDEALLGNEKIGLAHAQDELKRDPNCMQAHLILGVLYTHQSFAKDALEHLQVAALGNPDSPPIQSLYGHVLALAGQYDQAETVLRGVLDKHPAIADPYVWMATVWARRPATPDNLRQTEANLTLALAREPDHAEANFEMGQLRMRQNRPMEAIPALQRAVAGKPHYTAALNLLYQAYARTGKTTDAARTLTSFRREGELLSKQKSLLRQYAADPKNGDTAIQLAETELERQEPQSALMFLGSAKNSAPNDARIAPLVKRAETLLATQPPATQPDIGLSILQNIP